jgi:predicted porin
MASLGLQSAGTAAAIGGATRTPNVVHYTTPNWGGFYANIAYSFNPGAASEADINSSLRKGYAWNLNPVFEGRNFTIGYSYWSSKSDGTAVAANQRGDHLFGSYRWGGFRIGAVWDKSKVTNEGGLINAVTGSSTVARRDTWSIPVQYEWGPHWIGGHYTKANNDKATSGIDDGAKMWAIGYNYSLSKRTSVGVTYAQIRNDTGAIYTLFTSNGALGGGAPHQSLAGEDPKMWSMTIRHAF